VFRRWRAYLANVLAATNSAIDQVLWLYVQRASVRRIARRGLDLFEIEASGISARTTAGAPAGTPENLVVSSTGPLGSAITRHAEGQPMTRRILVSLLAPLVAPTAALAASVTVALTVVAAGPYASWSNYPQSKSFFPISVFYINPVGPMTGTGFASVTAAAKDAGINTWLLINGGAGVPWTPSGFGTDTSAGFNAVVASSMYTISQINAGAGKTPNNTDAASIASYQALQAARGYTVGGIPGFIGYSMGDEPESGTCNTWPMSALPSQIATFSSYDPTRPILLNSTDFYFGSGICNPLSLNNNYIGAIDIASIDAYPLLNAYTTACCTGTPLDAIWVQGWAAHKLAAGRTTPSPTWMFQDDGTNALGFSSQNGYTCSATTNTCMKSGSPTITYRATPAQVNSETWIGIINGSTGVEWFCHDTTAEAYCLGQGGSAAAIAVEANLRYIDATLNQFAVPINSPNVGYCTMITGTISTNFTTSCSGGILSLATGNLAMPASARVNNEGGTYYLFAQPARIGTGTLSFTLAGLAGATATVVYDSDAQYDAPNSSVSATFALDNSGKFADTFGVGGDQYQVKIYKITPA
jgi:hypothetical protein